MRTLRRFSLFRNLILAFVFLVIILAVGVVGYSFIEDYTILEAFYMTVITLSTVGYGEVRPLSEGGQLFTSVLIITSFGIFAYAVSAVTGAIFSGDLARFYKYYRLEKRIKKMENHVIICGYGRNGRRAAQKLQAYGRDFLVVEDSEERIDDYLKDSGLVFIKGDATQEEVLETAGIHRAKSIISTLSEDADNLYLVITARELNRNINIISRAASGAAEKKLKAVGANYVVRPEGVGGAHMATLTISPNIVEFLDNISVEGSSSINLEEIEVSQITDRVDSFQLKDLALRQKTGCTIIGLKTTEGEYVINPAADAHIEPNSKLFVLGNPEEIKKLNRVLQE